MNYKYIYDSVLSLYRLGEGTELCIFEPTASLYVKKIVSKDKTHIYRKLSEISSNHIAKVYYIDEKENETVILREFISGEPLSSIIDRNKTIDEDLAVKIVADICDGLSHLHKMKLVHRDINPNNIIVTTENTAKIIDFGISRSFDVTKSQDTVIMGTPGYAAPEQFGFTQSDYKADIYAAGVLLKKLIYGDITDRVHLNGRIGRIIKKSTSIDAGKRHKSALDLRNDLLKIYSGDNAVDRIISKIPGIRSKNIFLGVISTILHILLLTVIFFTFYQLKPGFYYYFRTAMIDIFLIIIPYFSFTNFGNIYDVMPFTKNCDKKTQLVFYIVLGTISIFVSLLIIGLTN